MTSSEQSPRPEDHVRTASRPSDLRITDMRTATVGWENWHFTIIRIDTKQVRAAGRATQGVRLLSLEPDDKVAAAVIIPPEELKDDEQTLLQ